LRIFGTNQSAAAGAGRRLLKYVAGGKHLTGHLKFADETCRPFLPIFHAPSSLFYPREILI
jgi:hypothetical protein